MKYCSESGILKTDVKELVTIARRSLSPIPTSDCEEPELSEPSLLAIKRAGLGRVEKMPLALEFEEGEYKFSISAVAMLAEDELIFTFEISGNPVKPRREELAAARGEAFITSYLYALENSLNEVKFKIIYINSADGRHAEQAEAQDIGALEKFFNKCRGALLLFAKPEIERVTLRLPSLAHFKFPYGSTRAGQDDFIRTVYRCIARGTNLYAQAPTGTGKTVSALYPALLALGRGKCDKVFYFTPKTTTALAARECLELCSANGARLRAVTLFAKEKLCQSGLLCREDRKQCKNYSCNRITEATLALYNAEITVVTDAEIQRFAREYTVCPHELSLSYAEIADVVIGDINYLFSPDVYIRRFFTGVGNYAFLIDEAHNLPDRAREMYSAEISSDEIAAPKEAEQLSEASPIKRNSAELARRFFDTLYPYLREELIKNDEGKSVGATHLSELPHELYEPFESMLAEADDEIYREFSSRDEEKKRRLKYLYEYRRKIKGFLDVMYVFDRHYEMFLFYEDGKIRAKLFCIDPEDRIRERLSHGRSAVFFSGTLSPLHYYRSTLGGDGSSETLEIDSPFDKGQISVSIMDKVSTRFSEREDTLAAVSKIIAATVSAKRGNYMIFTPSFAYAEELAKFFGAKYPKLHIMVQKRNMSTAEKAEFLAEFEKDDKSYLIAFCVMGGIYAEGIDLAGDSLIGAVIVGIGLPSLSYEREAIAAYYQEKYDEGKEFAYIYPGINRVLQAAGRVIRREDDKGAVVLIDDRFDDPIYKKLIPKLWHGMQFISSANELRSELDKFWRDEEKS